MGWNTEINWTSAATVSNVPPFTSASDIYDAFLERYKAINSPAIAEPPMLNGTVETLDSALRNLILGGEYLGLSSPNGGFTMHYVDMGSAGIGDFDNAAAIPPVWTIASLEAEIGAELPSTNGPLGAWAWWWHEALNLCTVIQRRVTWADGIQTTGFQYYWKFAVGPSWAQAVTDFNAEPWAVYSAQWSVNHFAIANAFGRRDIFRWRILVPGASGNSVYYAPSVLYTGNYTMAAYNPMQAMDGEYVNNDYAVDEGNYGMLYSDLTPTVNVDGKYQSDINIGNFNDATVTEPVVYDVLDGYVISQSLQRTLIDCDVTGGFEFV